MNRTTDARVPVGAPWEISDDTGNMYELRIDDEPGVPVMVYKGFYSALKSLHARHPMTAAQARQYVTENVNPFEPRYEEIPEGSVVVDRARFERLREYVAAHITFEAATVEREMTREIAERLVAALESLTLSDLYPLP